MIIRSLVFAVAVCFAGAAQAQTPWSSPAAACVPSDITTKFNRHKINNASVEHATGNIDPITFTCQIPRFENANTGWTLVMTYRDSTGNLGGGVFVKARLFRMPIRSAKPRHLATVSSNDFPDTVLATKASGGFTHDFDFNVNTYWVRIDMDRSTANQTVILHTVLLTGPT